MVRSGLRRRVAAGLVAVAGLTGLTGMAGCSSPADQPGPGGDPGGRILAQLTPVLAAVPPGSTVLLRQQDEPRWDSCDGRPGTFGWDDVVAFSQFRTAMPASALLAEAGRVLAAGGWSVQRHLTSPLGPGIEWKRVISDHARAKATLAPGQTGYGLVWEIDVDAPPEGRRVSGC